MPTPLSPARRSELRAEAHKLSPVVIIGDKGLTDAVFLEVDRALKAHELIKVRAASDDRKARAQWMADLCARLEALPVQEIGKVLVIWRAKPAAPEKAPAPKKAGAPAKRSRLAKPTVRTARAPRAPASTGSLTRSGRRQSRTPSPLPASGPRRRRPSTSR
jgi:RNA-binding protein